MDRFKNKKFVGNSEIIDAHIHVGQWEYKYYSSLNSNVSAINDLLDDCNIGGAVLMPTDMRNNLELLEDIRINGNKSYFYFAWMDPRDKTSIKFLNENAGRIDGLKFHSGIDQVEGGVMQDIYQPYLEFAEENEKPVIVHCGRWQEMSSYRFGLDAAEKYPTVRFILAHLGGDFEGLKIEAPLELKERLLKNVWFDISATREFWTIKMAVDQIGAEKLIFGSDFPVMHPLMSLESVNVLNLTDDDLERIFYKNLKDCICGENFK